MAPTLARDWHAADLCLAHPQGTKPARRPLKPQSPSLVLETATRHAVVGNAVASGTGSARSSRSWLLKALDYLRT